MKVQALFKGSSKAAPAKKTTAAPKKTSSGKTSGGWLGSASGDINLDKWYVDYLDASVFGCDWVVSRQFPQRHHQRWIPDTQDKVGI